MAEDAEFEYLYEEGNEIAVGVKITVKNFGIRYENGVIFSLDNLSIGDVGWSIEVRKKLFESVFRPKEGCRLFIPPTDRGISMDFIIKPISIAEKFERKTRIEIKVRGNSNYSRLDEPAMYWGNRVMDENTSHNFVNGEPYMTYMGRLLSSTDSSIFSDESSVRFFFKFDVYEKSEEDIWIPGENIKG